MVIIWNKQTIKILISKDSLQYQNLLWRPSLKGLPVKPVSKALNELWLGQCVISVFILRTRSSPVCSLSHCHAKGTHLSPQKDEWSVKEKELVGGVWTPGGERVFVSCCVSKEVAVVLRACFLINVIILTGVDFLPRIESCLRDNHTQTHSLDSQSLI